MLIMNFPHNPTGALLTAQEQLEVVELCKELDLWVFFDEVYRGLEMDPSQRLPPMCTLYNKAFSLGVMSKSLGMAGLRVGWLASQDKQALTKIAGYKHYLSICNSAPAEVLSLIALKQKDQLLDRNNGIIKENMVLVKAFLAPDSKYSKYFEWAAPAAGCIGYMRFKGIPGSDMTLSELADTLVTQHGCLLLPGEYFPSSTEGVYNDHFRFGFGRKNFGECLQKLEMALDKELFKF
jgi:aspartate/methionine/tyrosine aminotransferase